MLALPMNSEKLPYPDPIHPIIVHFVIAMVFFSFFCDVVGYFTHNVRLFEVSFWNMFVASGAIFLAVIFGQFEAGLAQVSEVAQPTLNFHTVMGWSLAVIIVGITAWRFVIRDRLRRTQRDRWRKNASRQVQWSYLLVGIAMLGILYANSPSSRYTR